jgi:predicted DNA-binding antitoxin AbrB/MazE fold protein
MSITVEAVYENGVLRPTEPLTRFCKATSRY